MSTVVGSVQSQPRAFDVVLLVWVCEREGVMDADGVGDVEGAVDVADLIDELETLR